MYVCMCVDLKKHIIPCDPRGACGTSELSDGWQGTAKDGVGGGEAFELRSGLAVVGRTVEQSLLEGR